MSEYPSLGHYKFDCAVRKLGRGGKTQIAKRIGVELARLSALWPGRRFPGRALSGKLEAARVASVLDWDKPAPENANGHRKSA